MRGTARCFAKSWDWTRITPACAGNSTAGKVAAKGIGDHPRVCGEQRRKGLTRHQLAGSPPRVRGTAETLRRRKKDERITPACAGNSSFFYRSNCMSWDHPRVCGEQYLPLLLFGGVQGSPPRVRGTVFLKVCRTDIYRITPACAGNRLKKARHFYILFCQIKRIHLV